MTKIIIIPGSSREGAFNRKLASSIAKSVESHGATATEVNLADYPMPIFNEDWESENGAPAEAKALDESQSLESDLVATEDSVTAAKSALRVAATAAATTATVASAAASIATATPTTVTPTIRRGWLRLRALLLHVRAKVGLAEDLAPVDPDLDTAGAVDRVGRALRVVNVSADGVERHAAFEILLDAAHLRTAEAACELDADALGTHAHCRAHRLLHRAAVGDAAFELLRDVVRDQLGVKLRTLDLADVNLDVLVGELAQFLAQLLDFGTAAADHDARTTRVERQDDALRRALDNDAR